MLDRIAAIVAGTAALVTGIACSQTAPQSPELARKWKDASLFDLDARALDGTDADLGEHRGKVALVVNVASQCGLTPQYAALQQLQEKYKDRGLVVLGFPSGDFGGQEFGSAKEIREFCDARYRITFPMFEKCRVKAGEGQSDVFAMLGTKTGELPGWNFGKYIVSRDGRTAVFFASNVAPDSKRMVEAIEKALAEPAPAKEPAKEAPAAEPTKEKPAKEAPAKEPSL
ncbi:MAG: glutathione peroxidase [Planctomycetota bacterium]